MIYIAQVAGDTQVADDMVARYGTYDSPTVMICYATVIVLYS